MDTYAYSCLKNITYETFILYAKVNKYKALKRSILRIALLT